MQTGVTALHRAAELGREDLVQLLLSHGAQASARDDVSEQAAGNMSHACQLHVCQLQDGLTAVDVASDEGVERRLKKVRLTRRCNARLHKNHCT